MNGKRAISALNPPVFQRNTGDLDTAPSWLLVHEVDGIGNLCVGIHIDARALDWTDTGCAIDVVGDRRLQVSRKWHDVGEISLLQ